MITDEDINRLKAVFATKEDLKGFATHKDLGLFTDEIVKLITAFREELKNNIKELTFEVRKMREGFQEILTNHEVRIGNLEEKFES